MDIASSVCSSFLCLSDAFRDALDLPVLSINQGDLPLLTLEFRRQWSRLGERRNFFSFNARQRSHMQA